MKAFRLLMAIAVALCVFPSIALAVDVDADKDVASGTTVTAQQKLNADGITLTNSGTIEYNGNTAVQTTTNKSRIKIINNAGGIIANTGGADKNYAIKGQLQTSLTIINSGTIESGAIYGIDIIKSTGTIITNNSGGIITAARQGIYGSNALTSNTTITNSGKIFVTDQKMAINFSSATGTTITNNAGGGQPVSMDNIDGQPINGVS